MSQCACSATRIAVIGGVTRSEREVLQRRADPRKAPPLRSHGCFSTKLSSGAEPRFITGQRIRVSQ